MPRKRKRIRPDEKVPVELNEREPELILKQNHGDEELTGRLCVMRMLGEAPVYHFTLDELDELAGCVAAEANHANDKKHQKECDRIYARMAAILDYYTDEDE